MADDSKFQIDDGLSLSDNLAAFTKLLESKDATLGKALADELTKIAAGANYDRPLLLKRLFDAMKEDATQ